MKERERGRGGEREIVRERIAMGGMGDVDPEDALPDEIIRTLHWSDRVSENVVACMSPSCMPTTMVTMERLSFYCSFSLRLLGTKI